MPLDKKIAPWLLIAALSACGSSKKSDGDTPANGTAGGGSNGANEPNTTTGDNNGTANSGSTNTGGTNTAGGTTGGSTTGGSPDAGPPPACAGVSAPDVPKLKLQKVVDGLRRLVYATQAPGSTDWYLVEQGGKIRVFTGGSLSSNAFLDVSSDIPAVIRNTLDYDERGLLGLAFAPDYGASGEFYIMLTNAAHEDIVFAYNKSNLSSRKEILKVPASGENHNGGSVMFGPDGFLYVGTGDGGGGCNNSNQRGAPQDVTKLWGKILRLDPKKSAPYAAAGNPFTNDARVLHYGLRNPFRFGFDKATGDLYIGDVGQKNQEEIDFAPAGEKGLNFGWLPWEGVLRSNTGDSNCDGSATLRQGSTHTPPIFAADRVGNTTPKFKDYASIMGGFVYRGSAIPSLNGVYIFGDWGGDYFGALKRCATGFSPVTPIHDHCTAGETKACFDNGSTDITGLSAIVEGNDGEIYLVTNESTLYKVVP